MNKPTRVINIPNTLSVLRILIIPGLLYFLAVGNHKILLLLLSGVAILTDFFDGYSARKLSQITTTGKILDPIADKFAVGIMVIGLIVYKGFPLWATIAIIGRDVFILLAGLYMIKRNVYIPVSNIIGKITVAVFAALILVYMFDLVQLHTPFLYFSMIFLGLSLFGYGREAYRQLSAVKNRNICI